ncbi:MAG: DinB family protein [Actinomycetota bacterium]
MGRVRAELVALSDEVWGRTRARLEGLSDDEYLWEPAEQCWSVRRGADGRWHADSASHPPDPAPFTTIAWRLWHLIDMYGEDRAPRWLDVPAQGEAVGLDGPDDPPGSADDALQRLDRAHDRWDAHLCLVDDASLARPLGPVAGPYAEASRAGYVLHMLDEFIHHAAEIATLRDLWRAQHTAASPSPATP